MARRRLEAAIQAGKHIEKGNDVPFERVVVEHTQTFSKERDGVYSLQYSHDGQLLAVGYGDGGVDMFSTKSGEMVKQTRKHKYGGLAVTSLRFTPTEQHVCYSGCADGKVQACSTIDGTTSDVVTEPGNEINCLDFCLDGTCFATAGKDLSIRIYDTATSKRINVYGGYTYIKSEMNMGHSQRVFALRYHPVNNHVFITGGWENHLKIWDSRSATGVQRTIAGPHVCGDGLDIKDNQILTGSWVPTDALQLWDFNQGSLLQTLPFPDKGEGQFLYCAQFCDRNTVLAGGSGTNSVHAINTNTKQVIGGVALTRPVQAMDSTSGGRLFSLAGMDTQLKMAAML